MLRLRLSMTVSGSKCNFEYGLIFATGPSRWTRRLDSRGRRFAFERIVDAPRGEHEACKHDYSGDQLTDVEVFAAAQPRERAGRGNRKCAYGDEDVADHAVAHHTLAPEEIRRVQRAADQRNGAVDVEDGSRAANRRAE